MISYEWLVDQIELIERPARAMSEYTNWDLNEMMKMSDADIAHKFQAGVHANLFSTLNVRQLIEIMDLKYKERPQNHLFLDMFDYLRRELCINKEKAHCMAIYLNMSPRDLRHLTVLAINDILFPAILENWLDSPDITCLLNALNTTYPNRLKKIVSSSDNPFVV
jgi:hypothetical protein